MFTALYAIQVEHRITEVAFDKVMDDGVGVLLYLRHAMIMQEVKEFLLAYVFLCAQPQTATQLDGNIERWLQERHRAAVDFEVDDGLLKLHEHGLLGAHPGGSKWRAARPHELKEQDYCSKDLGAGGAGVVSRVKLAAAPLQVGVRTMKDAWRARYDL